MVSSQLSVEARPRTHEPLSLELESGYDVHTVTEIAGLPEDAGASQALPDSARAGGGIDDAENLPRLFAFGLQHVLVMYAGTVAVPPILGSALRLSPRQVIALISADLFTSGLATLLQTLGRVHEGFWTQ